MQTFMPYGNFADVAMCLDNRRLNKQIIECWQIYQTLIGNSTAWSNHPIMNMWRGSEHWLLLYGDCLYEQWQSRYSLGKRGGNYYHKTGEFLYDAYMNVYNRISSNTSPFWLENEELFSNHRSILLGKNYEWYSQFRWKEKPAIRNEKGQWPYIWCYGVK